jgi:uncharacterized phage-like protein YoqJ
MNVQIRITAQVQENYSDNNIPYWKMKGGREFIIDNVDSDVAMYTADNEMDSAIQNMLDEYSNNHTRYTLIEWEVIFSSPIVLDTDNFMWELSK